MSLCFYLVENYFYLVENHSNFIVQENIKWSFVKISKVNKESIKIRST